MGVPFLDPGPMNAEEFFAFTAARPDDEKWELIDGEPVLNASASRLHQKILFNLTLLLGDISRSGDFSWEVLPGLGVRLSEISVPVPDLLIRPNDDLVGAECSDMMIAFEVLSPSTANKDLRWKRKAYATLPTLSQYVVVAQDAVEVVSYDRANNFIERRFESADDALDLPVIGARLTLRDIYRDTGLL
ncbi:Uma2 family endonuclease [Methylocystis parvus]|uniref:Uma2 family endonuclease n=1 Tax=Methylocystis parvus TaxID=134 RepID=A0A6B8MAL7_9HYPH|nr:Uma2 family endonuclease [Methylocystis parvus]QGM98333.1 Uma2 family endonuclease [Methylocystis parvus]WBK01339.1 Uma2 family endonuclease [Methylocystis parvus OBBP]